MSIVITDQQARQAGKSITLRRITDDARRRLLESVNWSSAAVLRSRYCENPCFTAIWIEFDSAAWTGRRRNV